MFRILYKVARKINRVLYYNVHTVVTYVRLKGNKVKVGRNFRSNGSPMIDVWDGGKMHIGDNVTLNNGHRYNPIGRQQPCMFVVRNSGQLTIGSNSGMSATAIVCTQSIQIGDFVKIGGNTVIYDTDFHSLDASQRADITVDITNTKSDSISIGNHVFIGAHSTILKGVSIGHHSIIGACSVVTRDVPPNEIWGGSPAKFIKKIETGTLNEI